jgi:hypothetical protein
VSSACGIIKLFAVAFCMVRALHKFDFRLVTDERPTNGYQWKEGQEVINTQHDVYVFSPTVVAIFKRLYPRCAGQLRSPEYGILALCKLKYCIRKGLDYIMKRKKKVMITS